MTQLTQSDINRITKAKERIAKELEKLDEFFENKLDKITEFQDSKSEKWHESEKADEVEELQGEFQNANFEIESIEILI